MIRNYILITIIALTVFIPNVSLSQQVRVVNQNKSFAGEISSGVLQTNREIFENAQWKTTKFSKEMILRSCKFDTLYGVPQNISILEIDPTYFKFEFVDHEGMKTTSQVAIQRGDYAALNGSFYDMSKGNSVCYLQINGNLLDTSRHDDIYPQINAALKIKNGRMKIIDWSPSIEKKHRKKIDHKSSRKISIMAAQPLLIKRGKTVYPLADMPGFNVRKHNRSVVYTKNGKVYFLVVDGRAKANAEGMSIAELCDFLQMLGAKNAINMDGGGSSTLFISSFEGNKIVNMPSDNKKFDHDGERAISNHIAVILK